MYQSFYPHIIRTSQPTKPPPLFFSFLSFVPFSIFFLFFLQVQFMMNTFFNVAVSHSCVIVATMWWCWLRSEKNSEHKSTTNYAISLNATRKKIMINIKLLSLPLACAVPCSGELFYGGSDGEFGLSDSKLEHLLA